MHTKGQWVGMEISIASRPLQCRPRQPSNCLHALQRLLDGGVDAPLQRSVPQPLHDLAPKGVHEDSPGGRGVDATRAACVR